MEKNLLPELISYIYGYTDVPYKAMILNKEIKHYASKNIYDIICNKPITESELVNVGYNTFGGVIHRKFEMYDQKSEDFIGIVIQTFPSIDINSINYILNIHLISSKQFYEDEVTGFMDYSNSDYKFNFEDILEFDLLTQYNIYNNRLNCMSINNKYAYNKTIEKFNNIIDTYSDELLFIYLFINYKVIYPTWQGIEFLNIDYETTIETLEETIHNTYKPFFNMIPTMIANIKKYFKLLYELNDKKMI
jgi:hypothetical protein